MNQSKRALLITYSSPNKLARVSRNLDSLILQGYTVDVLCTDSFERIGVNRVYKFDTPNLGIKARILRKVALLARIVVPSDRLRHLLTDYVLDHINITKELVKLYNVLFIEHIDFLRLCAENMQSGTMLIFDIKDYYPREFEAYRSFRILEAPYRRLIFRKYLFKATSLISVSNGLSKLLKSEYGMDSTIIMSSPPKANMMIQEADYPIKSVHHGTANADRGLIELVECRGFSSSCTLDLYLIGSAQQLDTIKRKAGWSCDIKFQSPVMLEQIIPTLNRYDVGIIFFPEAKTINLTYCLPNKFFEYIQANLMIITTPLPDIAELVTKYNLGIVLPSFSPTDLAICLRNLTPDKVTEYKKSVAAAAKVLCFENELGKLKMLV